MDQNITDRIEALDNKIAALEVASRERQETKSTNSLDALICAMQHFIAFHDQTKCGEIADFGDACTGCRKALACDFDWLQKVAPLCESVGVYPSVARQEMLGKQDNDHSYPA